MIYVIQYVRGDGGNGRYFYPANNEYLTLLKHIMEPNQYRIPEYEIEKVTYLAEAHGWRMIEVERKEKINGKDNRQTSRCA